MKKVISILAVIIVAGGVFTAFSVFKSNSSSPASTRPISDNTDRSTIVSANAAEPETSTTEAHSADGESNAILEVKSRVDGSNDYSLYACDKDCANKLLISQENLPTGQKIELPFNAWSPDNRYLFVAKKGGASADYLVFKATGETFAGDEKSMDVNTIFSAKQPDLKLRDVTGWDSNTLLHVFTTSADGKNGPSFWLEVPSGGLIQLGSH